MYVSVPTITPTASPTVLGGHCPVPMCDLVSATNVASVSNNSWGCTNGHPTRPICTGNTSTWEGVTCKNGVVTAIALSPVGKGGVLSGPLTGTLPTCLGSLSTLTSLNVTSNLLSGPIPCLVNMTSSLVSLDLSSNHFAGSIPTCLGLLTKLDELVLSANSLTGSVPSSLCGHSMTALSVDRISGGSNSGLTCYDSCLSTVANKDYGSLTSCGSSGKSMFFDYFVYLCNVCLCQFPQ
jgi:hypothetical protein